MRRQIWLQSLVNFYTCFSDALCVCKNCSFEKFGTHFGQVGNTIQHVRVSSEGLKLKMCILCSKQTKIPQALVQPKPVPTVAAQRYILLPSIASGHPISA